MRVHQKREGKLALYGAEVEGGRGVVLPEVG